MTKTYETGANYFWNIKGLMDAEPNYKNADTQVEIMFTAWHGKLVVTVTDEDRNTIEEITTKSIKNINKMTKKYGLEITEF